MGTGSFNFKSSIVLGLLERESEICSVHLMSSLLKSSEYFHGSLSLPGTNRTKPFTQIINIFSCDICYVDPNIIVKTRQEVETFKLKLNWLQFLDCTKLKVKFSFLIDDEISHPSTPSVCEFVYPDDDVDDNDNKYDDNDTNNK